MGITVYLELKKFLERNNYICPNPIRWLELYHILDKTRNQNSELKLEVPPLRDKWDSSSVPQKRKRFMDQVEYGFKNGNLMEVDEFLRSLDENEWLIG